jgi:hypothetical protein
VYVHGSHTFLVKVEMVLLHKWAHPKIVTFQISLSKLCIHWTCNRLEAGAVVPAVQMHNVRVELSVLHTAQTDSH